MSKSKEQIDTTLLSTGVIWALCASSGVNIEDDDEFEALMDKVKGWSVRQIMDVFLKYHGVHNLTKEIIEACESIQYE